jgi:CheY-like chemotaxis protein
LSTDEGKVVQILRNFISNALKFTSQGEVRVSARFDKRLGRVHLIVRDTGIGIDPSQHERLFQEFSQIDNPMQRSVKGTGLGLPLSQRLAGLLGGEILVNSALGKGSTFTLSIPPLFGESAASTELPLAAQTVGHCRRVLVVDDEDAFRYVFRQMLSVERGYEVIEAVNGRDCLRRAKQDRPDVIVLDLQMPEMDGYETLRHLADGATAKTPVIIATSSVIDDEMKRRLSKAIAIISKESLSREAVCSLLEQVTQRAGMAQ